MAKLERLDVCLNGREHVEWEMVNDYNGEMAVIERNISITWVAREAIKGVPGYKATEASSIPYHIPEHALSPRDEYENQQPDVDWTPRDKRPYDYFGRLWVERRLPEEPDELGE